MKFNATAGDLTASLSVISGVVERKSTMPILSNALLQTRNGLLQFKGSDLQIEVTARTKIQADANITIEARKLLSILKTLPPESQVTLEQEDNKVKLKSGKSRFTLQTLPASGYPVVNESAEFGEPVTLIQGAFKSLLKQVAFAMAQNDIRYYLNGLLFHGTGSELRLVGTDGHRLAYTSCDAKTFDAQYIVPSKAIDELQRLLSDGDEPITIRFASNQVRFDLGSVEMTSKLIDGRFPDYARVIPKNDAVAVINRAAWHGANHRASMLASEKQRAVSYSFQAGQLSISAKNAHDESSSDVVDIDYNGPEFQIGFNVAYVQDVLSNMETDSLEFHLKDSNTAGAVKSSQHPNFVYVVMPMRI